MSDLFSQSERKTPDSWSSILSSVPESFRAALLQAAWKTHDETMQLVEADATRTRGHDHITAQSTAMAAISAAVFMPLHLVKPDAHSQAIEALSKSVTSLSKWLRASYPTADNVLIVGDQPRGETLNDRLDEVFEKNPAKRLICGPGTSVESLVRIYAEERNFGLAQIGSIDGAGKGAGWQQVPGPKLQKMVEDLFRQFNPDRVVAFEPVQMPAAHLALEKALTLNLPILRIEAPSVKSRPKV